MIHNNQKFTVSHDDSISINENIMKLLGITPVDISTLLGIGVIIENNSYRNLDSILSEAVIYENFLNSVKQFLQARYDETVDDVALRIRNTKDAGVLIKEIISDAELLDRVLIQLNKQLRVMLRTLNAKIVELRSAAQAAGTTSGSAASLQKFYNLVNNLVNRSIRVRGWQGFLISLGTHTILKFSLLQINELKTVAAQLNFFSSQQSTALINKIEDISRLSINISATTMMNYMGIFTEVVGLVNVMLDTLSNIRRKLQVGARITLANNPMQETTIRNEYEFWKNITENKEIPEKKSASANERILLSAILTLHKSVLQNQEKDIVDIAFDIVKYFNLPIRARELAKKYNEIIRNGTIQLGELVKIRNHWALVSKLDTDRIIAIYPKENETPSEEWIKNSMTAASRTVSNVQLEELKSINKEYVKFSSELDEIYDIPVDKSSRKDWLKDYNYWDTNIKSKNAKTIGEFFSYQVYWITHPYKIEIVVLDIESKEAIVMMSLRKLNSDFYQVDKVATNESHAGKGLAHKLYRKIILDGVRLMSDTEQSPGGKRIWLELARMPDIAIYGIDYNQTPPVYTDVRIDNDKLYGDYDLYTSHIIEKLDKKQDQLKDSIAVLRSDIDRAINSDADIKQISRLEHELETQEKELEKLEYYNPEDSRDYMRKVRLAAIKNSGSLPYKRSQSQLTEVEYLPDYERNRDYSIPSYESAIYGIKISGSKKIGTVKGLSIYLEPDAPSKFGKIMVRMISETDRKTAGILELYPAKDYPQARPRHWITGEIAMATDYQGKGIPSLVYALLIKKMGMTLMSGGLQSKGGISIWKNLYSIPGIFVYAVDMNNPEKPKFTQIDTDDFFIHGDFDLFDQSFADTKRIKIDDLEEMIELINKDIRDEELADIPNKAKISQWQEKIKELEKKRNKIARNFSKVHSWIDIRLMAVADKQEIKS